MINKVQSDCENTFYSINRETTVGVDVNSRTSQTTQILRYLDVHT